jgi:hypothetical protein
MATSGEDFLGIDEVVLRNSPLVKPFFVVATGDLWGGDVRRRSMDPAAKMAALQNQRLQAGLFRSPVRTHICPDEPKL